MLDLDIDARIWRRLAPFVADAVGQQDDRVADRLHAAPAWQLDFERAADGTLWVVVGGAGVGPFVWVHAANVGLVELPDAELFYLPDVVDDLPAGPLRLP